MSNINAARMSTVVFESHKKVKNCPMTRGQYNTYRDWITPADENPCDDGYLVEYLDGGKPNDPRHKGYISWTPKPQFDNGYSEVEILTGGEVGNDNQKSLGATDTITAKSLIDDLVVWGDGDLFKLISKSSSKNQGWMKSTKAMQVTGGCVVQVTTQQGGNIAEAVTYVPGVEILHVLGDNNLIVARHLVPIGTVDRTPIKGQDK